jgi:hypothetical protein
MVAMRKTVRAPCRRQPLLLLRRPLLLILLELLIITAAIAVVLDIRAAAERA